MSKHTVVILGDDESARIAAARVKEVNCDARVVISTKTCAADVSLDMDSRTVAFRGEKPAKVGFDTLVFCSGIENRRATIEGLLEEDIQCASNLDQTSFSKKRRATVLGCGRDGIMVSQALKKAGLEVRIFEKSPRILPRHSFEIGQRALRTLNSIGIKTFLNDEILSGKKNNDGSYKISSSRGLTFETDLIVSAIGASPVNSLLTSVGALTTQDGSLFVDETMSTSLTRIYACGEGISPIKALSNNRHFRPSNSMIERGAQVAGSNAARQKGEHSETMQHCAGLEILRLGELVFTRTGLSQNELEKMKVGEDFVRATVTSGENLFRLYTARKNRSLVAAEIVGSPEVACQIQLLSLFILKEFPAEELIDFDVPTPLREAAEHIRSALNLEFESVSGEKIALWLAQNKPINWIDVGDTPSSIFELFKNAQHIPLKDIKRKSLAFSNNDPMVLTSVSGRSAIEACRFLRKRGFDQVFQLDGGAQTLSMLLGEKSIERV